MKPNKTEYADYFHTYVKLVEQDDLLTALKEDMQKAISFFISIPEDKSDYAYSQGKWTIKDIIGHLMDAERIFCYRALRFARNDATELEGFDHDTYVKEANCADQSLQKLITDFQGVRLSTIALFSGFDDDMLARAGMANKNSTTVRAMGFIIVGHTIHHCNVIKERYL